MNRSILASLVLAAVALLPAPSRASYAIFVGSHLTADGSTFLGGTGDEPSSHWLEIVPERTWPAGSLMQVGVDSRATFPGELMEIPQVARTARYISMNYSEYAGFPAPLTNGGLNEYGVAARDVWSPSRPELQKMTPNPQHGLNYSDLSRIAMERAHSAREAVEIVGALIDKYGYATYGGNSHFFADAQEGWVLIDFAGGQRLWIAERVGPDEVRMSYPGYIEEVPLDFQHHPDHWLGSSNFISFAESQGWYDPHTGQPFSVNRVYQNGKGRSPTVRLLEQRLRDKAAHGKISLRDMLDTVRDPLVSGDQNGYGQVAHLRRDPGHADLNVVWIAATGSIVTPFVPYWIGTNRVLPEYGKHRYLSSREAEYYVSRDFQIQEAAEFAYITFKRLMYYTCDQPKKFLPEVTEALTAFENESIARLPDVEMTARLLYQEHHTDLARLALTDYSTARATSALTLGKALLGSIEVRHRLLYGYRAPQRASMISDDKHDDIVQCAKHLPWE
jgi:dipeptidase